MDHLPTRFLSGFYESPYGIPHFVSSSISLLQSLERLQLEHRVLGGINEDNLLYGRKGLTLVQYEVHLTDSALVQGLFELSLYNIFEILLQTISRWSSGQDWTGHAMLLFDSYLDTLPAHPEEPFLRALSHVSPTTYVAFKRMLRIPRSG